MTLSFPALLVGLSSSARGQSPAPAAAQTQSAGTGEVTTLKARSNLVIVDVVVTDKNHRPVHGLKATDFQVREGGLRQVLKSVEEHVPEAPAPGPPMGPQPAGVFTNYTPVPGNGPVNVLLIDRLNTPMESQVFLHQQLVEFIKKMKPGTRIAVFGLNRELVYLQGVTSDPKVLLAALEAKKNGTRQSALLDAAASTKASDQMSDAAVMMGMDLTQASNFGSALANLQQFEAQGESFQTQLRVRYTLDAMNVLARYLAALPGRKNLIWFSGSFPLSILPDQTVNDTAQTQPIYTPNTGVAMNDPFANMADMREAYRETTELLARSQVAVYPIDARGVQSTGVNDASQNMMSLAMSPKALAKAHTDASDKTADEHMTMLQMAADTGGQAFINTNGLADAVGKAIESGSSYYTLTYTPADPNYDGSFRKIQVTTTPGGYGLAYRKGYFTDGGAKKPATSAAGATMAETAQQVAVKNSMRRGAPEPTQILFKVYVGPLGPPTDAAVAETNVATSVAKGPYRRYTVGYAALPGDFGFRNAGPGKYDMAMEFVAVVYDANGVMVNSTQNTVRSRVTPAEVKAMMATGLQFRQTISVPAKGEYFLRVGIHDLLVDHVGAVEIPVAAVKHVPVTDSSKTPVTDPLK